MSLDLPINVKMDIQAATSNDRLVWPDNPHGNFDLKSAYKLATENDSVSFEGECIWRIKIIHRIQFFVWKCLHNRIRVNSCLVARGVTTDTLCPLFYV